MGKTPERANGSAGGAAGPVMRYRRKVPTATPVPAMAAGAEQQPVAADVKQQDNQVEHRETDPVVGDVKSEPLQQTPKQKLLNPGGPARKKKPKAHENVKNANDRLEEATSAAVGVDATAIVAMPASLPKKKAKKRQLPNNNASDEPEAVEPCPHQESLDQTAEPVKPRLIKQNSNRKHKNDVNNGKHKGPSLLKQLLWKAKPVASLPVLSESSLSSDSPLQDAAVPPPSVAIAQHKHSQSKTKRTHRTSAEDQDEQEEVAYTVSERHNRKLQAVKTAVESDAIASDTCCASPVVCGELSSQETQSGSDDEEASTSFLAYENLVPSGAIEPKDLSTAVQLQLFYPAPFPLALATDVELLKQHGIKVHEVVIEDFAFHPPQLRVQPGDVVLWNVSVHTLGMVEHSLDASLMLREPKQKKPTFIKATTPPLGSGSSFAWRFEVPARIHIECSVYQTKGVVVVMHPKTKKEKKTLDSEKFEPATTVETAVVAVEAPLSTASQAPIKAQKRKEKAANRKRAAAEARAAATAAALTEGDSERGRDSLESDAVFHPPQNLAQSAEMDAGVCRAVLTQLEEVVAAVHAATDVIVVGDVECPVLLESSNQDESENPADQFALHVHPDHKPSALADEWSGTEEDDDDVDEDDDAEHRSASSAPEENEIEDFQQRIIGMLKRSEDARAQHRRSFQQDLSGFDAGAAYDFFKQRFMRVQEEQQIVYAACPEPQSGSGVGVTEVVSLLSGSLA